MSAAEEQQMENAAPNEDEDLANGKYSKLRVI